MATYQLSDETNQKNFRLATAKAIRIHDAAGAQEILVSLAHRQLTWRRGQNLKSFIKKVVEQPLLDGAQPMISAHQLSTCRMGTDPATSVADTSGELHDVKGVWVGDASACPTALGANPMVTIMALAERTADRMAVSSGEGLGAIPELAGDLFRAAVGIMTGPLRLLDVGRRAAWGPARRAEEADTGWSSRGPRAGRATFAYIIELIVLPGQQRRVVEILRDEAIPRIIQPADGFIDELVFQSLSDPNFVTVLSFWVDKDHSDRFDVYGFDQLNSLLQPHLAAPPERRPFHVGASTNPKIPGSTDESGSPVRRPS